MKAGLPTLEPKLLDLWKEKNIAQKLEEKGKGRPLYVLHDGPPYANGHMHIGHALNRILKDFLLRSKQMQGYYCPFIPGWDCHGLPIEWKIEEQYRKDGKNKDEVDLIEFREQCRSFAAKWVDIQKTEAQRLGLVGRWDNPYTTMKFENESVIAAELSKFLLNGGLYRGCRPVMWSVIEKTALAEAEVEYKNKTSASIFVRFKTQNSSKFENASVVIWTTTPWTLPANRAVAYHPEIDYVVFSADEVSEASAKQAHVQQGERFIVAKDLLSSLLPVWGIAKHSIHLEFKGSALEGLECRHPLYDFNVPLLPAEYVSTDTGTGLVHTAPSHGVDDFMLGKRHNLDIPDLLQDDGRYRGSVPLFAGQHIFQIDKPMFAALIEAGTLVAADTIEHSYPHSWRSKTPLIFRTTPQWFISMETNDLRKKALDAIGNVNWFPEAGQNRITAMVEGRPDWCISRQRAWGVPLPIFVHKETLEILKDERVQTKIIDEFKIHGADVWFTKDNAYFLGDLYPADAYEKVKDVVDVWFESGTTHVFTLEKENLWPADLYLEGSDQHRGWFQSSLLESCGTKGKAPYKGVLTHGFVLDEKGYKMSKSIGNVISPLDIVKEHGADILRLWVVNSDYFDDIRVGNAIIKHQQDIYRRYRNILRYLLGALANFSPKETVEYNDLPDLEKWVLKKVYDLGVLHKECVENFDFKRFYAALNAFCASELSSIYFDIRKDSLYCDNPESLRRRSCRTVMHHVFEHMVRWIAPVLCFTAEEAFLTRYPDAQSVHLELFLDLPEEWKSDLSLEGVLDIRSEITGAIEKLRADKVIGSSLQAEVSLALPEEEFKKYQTIDWEEICIVSKVTMTQSNERSVSVSAASGHKCERCWKVEEVLHLENTVCGRCKDVISA